MIYKNWQPHKGSLLMRFFQKTKFRKSWT